MNFFISLAIFLLAFPAFAQSDDELALRKLAADQARARATQQLVDFRKKQLSSQRLVIDGFNELIKAGYDSGSHDIVDKWEKARDDFMQSGQLPKDAPESLARRDKEAKQFRDPPKQLFEALDDAVVKLKADKQDEEAEKMQKRRDELIARYKPATASATSTAPAATTAPK